MVKSSDLLKYDGKLLADASDLGIPPGRWPDIIMVDADEFQFIRIVHNADDTTEVIYESPSAMEQLILFND